MALIFDWPDSLRPAEVEWGLVYPQEVQRGIDGSPQVDLVGAPRWQVQIVTGPLKLSEAPEWEAKVDKLRGSINRTRLWDWRREAPLGNPGGAPSLALDATGNTATVQGWTPARARVLAAGSWMGINGELKRLTETVDSDGGGSTVITFEPPLRQLAPAGSPLILGKPRALFILKGNPPSFSQKGARCPGVTLAFEEVFA